MANRNTTIDILKGIAIILVVYGHVIQRSMSPYEIDAHLNPVFKLIYTFHMPLFFFLSGYAMVFSLNRRGILDIFKDRCQGLLVPCMVWGMLGVVIHYFLDLIDGRKVGIVDLPWNFLEKLVINPVVWFLFVLFVLSAVLLLSLKLQQRFGPTIIPIIYFLILMIPYNNYCGLYYIKWFYLFYLGGYFINKYGVSIRNKAIKIIVLCISLLMFVWLSQYWTPSDYIYVNKMNFVSTQYVDELLRVIYRYVMGGLGILIACCIGGYLLKTKAGNFLGYIGIYSLDIYLIQRYIVEGIYPRLIVKAQVLMDFNSGFFLYVYAPVFAMVCVGVCIVMARGLLRKNDLLNRLLLGNR